MNRAKVLSAVLGSLGIFVSTKAEGVFLIDVPRDSGVHSQIQDAVKDAFPTSMAIFITRDTLELTSGGDDL